MGAEFIWLHSASDFSGKRSEYSDRNGICRLSGFSARTEWGIYFTRGKNWKKLRDFSTGDSKGFGAPTIGDDVYIGAGARIIGNVRIGNQCRIGANCVVTRDVPDRATVVLAEPRVLIHKEERDNSFRKISGEIE